MKIVFLASIDAMPQHKKYYATIVNYLKNRGHKVYHLLSITGETMNNWSQEKKERVFSNFYKIIRESDLVIAECSFPSINIGYEISHAIQNGKEVIILQATDLDLPISNRFLYTDQNSHIYKYNKEILLQILNEAVEFHAPKNNIDLNSFSDKI